jgi:TrmH family RNA methyltransferase
MLEITSGQNPRFKAALQLHSSRGRKKQNRYIVFGQRESRRAIESGVEVAEAYLCHTLLDADMSDFLEQSLKDDQLISVPIEMIKKLEFGDRCEGVALVVRRPATDLQRCLPGENSLTLVLESIEKPGNLGAILRSCDGAGVDSVVLANPLTDFFHHNCIRASLGAVFSLTLATGTTEQVVQYLNQNEFASYAAIVNASRSYRQADYSRPRTAIVFGNEANGLSPLWSSNCEGIYIPMNGIADSLNVSVSAAIVAYEAVGQRKSTPTS